jgi:secretion/DNA translocation related TadE-like protein
MTVRRRTDSGSGTVWVLSVLLLLTSVAVAGLLLAGALARHARASAAADLAALAAAAAVQRGAPDSACAAAARVAQANGAELSGCARRGEVVDVETVVRAPAGRFSIPAARAAARAGPVAR